MFRKIFEIVCCCCLMTWTAMSQEATPATKPSPAEGYNIHVLAPHMVDGQVKGPYHHYCKVVAPDPQIVCLIFESTEPNAMLMQVEYIWAKSLTRPKVPLKTWNKYWHDHAVEIGPFAVGRALAERLGALRPDVRHPASSTARRAASSMVGST